MRLHGIASWYVVLLFRVRRAMHSDVKDSGVERESRPLFFFFFLHKNSLCMPAISD